MNNSPITSDDRLLALMGAFGALVASLHELGIPLDERLPRYMRRAANQLELDDGLPEAAAANAPACLTMLRLTFKIMVFMPASLCLVWCTGEVIIRYRENVNAKNL